MRPVLLVPPATEPVTLAEAKAWLRIETADDDALVASLVRSARGMVEAAARRVLVTQTWRLLLDTWPAPTGGGPVLPLPLAPVSGIAGVMIKDRIGQSQAVASDQYWLVGAPDEPKLFFTRQQPEPGQPDGIAIDIVAGYGAPEDVPEPLRQAVLILVAHFYENRGDAGRASPERLPAAAAGLIAPFRRVRLT